MFLLVVLDPDLILEKALEGADGFGGILDLYPPGHNLKTVKPELSGETRCYIYELKRDVLCR